MFAEPLLAAHDRDRFEIFCYQNYAGGDEVTARFAALADHFVPIASMPDAEAARRIRDDAIDILVDLNGHTAHNRLPLFSSSRRRSGHLARLSGQHRRADDRLPR